MCVYMFVEKKKRATACNFIPCATGKAQLEAAGEQLFEREGIPSGGGLLVAGCSVPRL